VPPIPDERRRQLIHKPGSSVEGKSSYVAFERTAGVFPLAVSGRPAPICIAGADHPGVIRIARMLQADIERVTDARPEFCADRIPVAKELVLIGTLGRSPLIDRLVREGIFDASDLAGRREMFILQPVDRPLPGVERALVIAGSDKRGTLYGMLDLSDRIGVSPWYWWADVPPRRQRELYVRPGRHTFGEPAVTYRGFFINDEAPALTKWALEKFGGFNHRFYEKVFELLLRLKGNYLWPAMWGSAFHDDDPINPVLADEYGIVIGTSHHEPMMRAHQEWARYGTGPWNYMENEETLRRFWEEGARGIGSREVIVTVGMRGDGDMPMTAGTNIALLERIVRDQREILTRVTGKDPADIPQLWAIYKEVQDYYDRGMRVPEDVTLLLCDDNWGNIRRLPKPGASKRTGGYGIYYHFDYVGDPRNYKWLNTSPIARTWEQMHLAYRHGVDRIWIVNVGDIKPLELPIHFFLDYAWDPEAWPAERLPEYTRAWSERQFGAGHAAEIARILSQYTRFNGRRKPELLAPDTYSLIHSREAERVVGEYNRLAKDAECIAEALPSEYRDAYYQLVLHPALACANLNELYVTAGRNRLYAAQGRAATNDLAARVKFLFERDAEYSRRYNESLAGGKWSHMMDQTHIGYTTWQQPKENSMPEVKEIQIPDGAEMGVSIEDSEDWWPQASREAVLPEFDPYRRPTYFIEIFNRGRAPFEFRAEAGAPWLSITPAQGTVDRQMGLSIEVDWRRIPVGMHTIPIVLAGPQGVQVTVRAVVRNPEFPKPDQLEGFIEGDGYVSMEAEHYTRAVESGDIRWQCIPEMGRTLSGMTPFPVTAGRRVPGGDSPRLEYRMHLFSEGPVKVHAFFSPTLDYLARGLQYAVSFDDDPPQTVDLCADSSRQAWEKAVAGNIKISITEHPIASPGAHVLRFWMVDPGVVLQKIVVDAGGLRPSYLGPPESYRRPVRGG
jgi:hypothetical protein